MTDERDHRTINMITTWTQEPAIAMATLHLAMGKSHQQTRRERCAGFDFLAEAAAVSAAAALLPPPVRLPASALVLPSLRLCANPC